MWGNNFSLLKGLTLRLTTTTAQITSFMFLAAAAKAKHRPSFGTFRLVWLHIVTGCQVLPPSMFLSILWMNKEQRVGCLKWQQLDHLEYMRHPNISQEWVLWMEYNLIEINFWFSLISWVGRDPQVSSSPTPDFSQGNLKFRPYV